MPIPLIDTLTPANNGTFPMVKAKDVEYADGTRLEDQLVMQSATSLPTDAASHPKTVYLIVEEDGDDSA